MSITLPTEGVRLTCRVLREANVVEVRAVGNPAVDPDNQSATFRQELATALIAVSELDAGVPRRLLLNLRGLRFLNGWVIAAMVRQHHPLRSVGAEMVVFATPPAVEALRLIKLDRIFRLAADGDELKQVCGVEMTAEELEPFAPARDRAEGQD